VARAPLTAIIIVFEITGDYSLVLPLMLAASLATFLADRVHPESAYTQALAAKGIRLISTSEVDILDTVQVGDVMSQTRAVVLPAMTTAEVQGMLDRYRHHGLPVVDGDGSLVGIITVTDVVRAGGASDQVAAADVMTPRPVTVTPGTPVAVALERMAALGVGRIPVVSDEDPDRLVGMFRREDAVRAYHHALTVETQHELARQRLRTRIAPGANFFEFVIPRGSVADGRNLKEVAWPEGATLVSVHRGRTVMVPDGNTVLEAGDIITAFATPTAQERLMNRLRQSAETPG
jgi:CIC family chloride channel protein